MRFEIYERNVFRMPWQEPEFGFRIVEAGGEMLVESRAFRDKMAVGDGIEKTKRAGLLDIDVIDLTEGPPAEGEIL